MLLRQADRRLGLCEALAGSIPDRRDPAMITHRHVDLLRQRIYGIALGYVTPKGSVMNGAKLSLSK